jgi:transcriptional regulator with XRE-family HTH domain
LLIKKYYKVNNIIVFQAFEGYNLKINKYKVKELMAKKKISTQKELADMLGISKNQLSNILSDKFNPIKINVVELANFLGVSPLEIIEEKKASDELHRK